MNEEDTLSSPLFRIFCARAGAEIERRQALERLRRSGCLSARSSGSVSAVCAVCAGGPLCGICRWRVPALARRRPARPPSLPPHLPFALPPAFPPLLRFGSGDRHGGSDGGRSPEAGPPSWWGATSVSLRVDGRRRRASATIYRAGARVTCSSIFVLPKLELATDWHCLQEIAGRS